MNNLVPKKVFFTNGVGISKHRLMSFEMALRDCGVEKCNLVTVSSILPPHCKIVSRKKGVKLLEPGQITFAVMSKNDTDESNRLISAAIGLAVPTDKNSYGYLSEVHLQGSTDEQTGELAEDLSASMLATTLGIEFDAKTAWNDREQVYRASGKVLRTSNVVQSARGKNGFWTTVVAAAIFVN